MTAAGEHGSDAQYSRLAELAEQIATAIAVAEPDWCALARDAAELAAGTRERCEMSA